MCEKPLWVIFFSYISRDGVHLRESWLYSRKKECTPSKVKPYNLTVAQSDLFNLFNVSVIAATSDATLSLVWSSYDSNLLITGQAQKFLRVFDMRGGSTTFLLIVPKVDDNINKIK